MLKDTMGTSMIRVNAAPGMSPVVTELMARFGEIGQRIQNTPKTVVSDFVNTLSVEDTSKFIEATSTTNNTKTRCGTISNMLFSQYIDQIQETRTQLDMVEGMCKESVEMMLVSQYGDLSGNVAWSELNKNLAIAMAIKAQQATAQQAAPPANGLGA